MNKNCLIFNSYYLSNCQNIDLLSETIELSQDEIEGIVGRFTKTSSRSGQLRGEVVEYVNEKIVIRHHFTKKVLWRND